MLVHGRVTPAVIQPPRSTGSPLARALSARIIHILGGASAIVVGVATDSDRVGVLGSKAAILATGHFVSCKCCVILDACANTITRGVRHVSAKRHTYDKAVAQLSGQALTPVRALGYQGMA